MKHKTGRSSPSPCPSPEALAISLQTRLSAGERDALLDHLLVCPECRIRYAVLREVKAEIKADEPRFRALARESRRELRAARRKLHKSRPEAGRALFPRRGWAFAAAGLLFVLAGLASYSFISHRSPFKFIRGAGAPVLKIRAPLVLSDGRTLLLRWKPVDGANGYLLEVVDDGLVPLVEKTGGKATAFIVHLEKHPGALNPGKTYVLYIEAYHDDGSLIARASRTFSLR